MYVITPHTKRMAKQIGVEVRPSTRKNKKLDVYKDGKHIATIGDTAYGDYGSYLEEKGKTYADERRRLYHVRHTKKTVGEQMALQLLW